jgi:cell division protein FtsB
MPPARTASAPQRRPRHAREPQRPHPRRLIPDGAKRVRWDRIGRIGLLVVLAVVAGVYVQDALSYLSTKAQADHEQAVVQRLSRENAQLERRQKSLNDPETIVRAARELGMVRAGERSYVIIGLAGH